MKKIKALVLSSLAFMTVGVVGIASSQPAMAAYSCPSGTIRAGSSVENPAQCNVEKDKEGKGLMPTVLNIINFILAILGIVAVIIIILGGVTYLTSTGDPAKATKARNTILYGIIGLVVALLAFAIVNFVLDGVFNPKKGDDGGNSAESSQQ